jgi:WD40 repeat protein
VVAALACSKDKTLRVEPIIGIEHASRVAFDPRDEMHFLVVERAGAIVVWKRVENDNVRVLTIRTDAVDAIFYGDGIASVHRDGSLRRWRLDGTLKDEARPEQPSRATAIEALGNRIVTADESGRIHVWSARLEDSPVDAHPGGVIAVAADEQRGVVVSVGKDEKVLQWRTGPDGPLTDPRAIPFPDKPLAVAFASDGVLAIGGQLAGGGEIDLIDLSRDAKPRVIEFRSQVTSVSFSRLTGALAASGEAGPITINRDGRIWMTEMKEGRDWLDKDGVDIVKFSPRGELLAAIWDGGSIVLHSITFDGKRLPKELISNRHTPSLALKEGRARAESLVRPLGDGFVAATTGGDLTFTDAYGKTTKRFSLPGVARFVALGVADANGFVALASDDGRAWVCRGGTSPSLLPDTDIRDLAVARTGLIAAQHSSDAMVRFMRADGSGPAPNAIQARFLVQDMVFINDETLALLGREGLDLVSISGQRRPAPALPAGHDFNLLAASPDGTRFAAGASDGTITLFDGSARTVATLRPDDLSYPSESTMVTDLAFSGREVLASAHTGVVRLWNMKDGTQHLPSIVASVVSIAFARNTDVLIALNGDGEATICIGIVTPLSTGSLQSQSWNTTATVSPNGEAIVTALGTTGVFWWKPDGSATSLSVDAEHFQRITDVAFSRDGRTLFALTDTWSAQDEDKDADARPRHGEQPRLPTVRTKPVVASNGTQWQIGEPVTENQLATTGDEAIYVVGSRLHRWRAGHPSVAGARLNASAVKLAPIAATEDIALGGVGTVAVSSRDAVTWQKNLIHDIVSIAAPSRSGELMFAASSSDARVTLWRPSGRGWEAAYTVPTSDATLARALAFDSHGQLLIGTDGGTLELRDVRSGKRTVDPVHLGNSILRVGTTTNRVWASLGSDQIVFLSLGLEIKATMTLHDNQAIIATPSGWHSGTVARARFFRGTSSEPLAEQETMAMYSPAAVAVAITGPGETWENARAFFLARINDAKETIGRMSWWQRLLAIPPLLYGLVFVLLSLTWLIAPHRLAGWAMQRRDERDPPPFTVFTKSLLLIHWLGHTTRAVDAWILRSQNELLSKCFTSLDNVKKRSQYVDLGNAPELDAWHAAVEKRQEIGLWIAGPGGCGKSTLAFALARHAIAGIRRPPLPVLVDTDWAGELLDFVRQQLSIGERWMTAKMLAGLARRGRIILVVDGLSERRVADAKAQVTRSWTSGVLRYLIVASRDDAPEEAHMREVRVGSLTAGLLPAFAREYIADEKVDSAVQQLQKLANEQGIRPLFARLALERIAAGTTLPTNYPNLVHEYVVELRPRDPNSLAKEDFLRAARICAFSVVDEHLAPTQVSDNYIRARLNDESFVTDEEIPRAVSGAECIKQLVKCGLLDQVEAYGAILLRFSFDLIAEYLAAMEVVHRPALERNARLRETVMAAPSSALREALDRVLEMRAAA